MNLNYSALKKKEVLEVTTGKNLGKIFDLVIETQSGRILKIVVPGKKNGFLSCENVEISYKDIVKIGDDVILVELCRPKKDFCEEEKPRHDKPCDECCCENEFDDER